MNTKAKGARQERKVKDLLTSLGWNVTKAGASLGIWDLVAINTKTGNVALYQVKSNRCPPAKELARLKMFADAVRKFGHFSCWLAIVKDRQGTTFQRL